MIASFFLALREGVEAALIIGILFGALRKIERPDLAANVWLGTAAAVVVSLLAALGLKAAGAELEGAAEKIFEGVTMLLAALMLTYMVFWVNHSSTLKGKIETNIGQAARAGGWALAAVAFTAVVREGIELALFLIAAGFDTSAVQTGIGAVLGLAGAAALGWVLFHSARRLPLRAFFKVTNLLLALFAAGLLGRAAGEFNEAGLIPPVIAHLYNISAVLHEDSLVGQVFSALFGYSSSPSLTQVVVYCGYFALLFFGAGLVQRLPGQKKMEAKA